MENITLYVIVMLVGILGVIGLVFLIARCLLFLSKELRTGAERLLKEVDREKLAWRRLWTRTVNGHIRSKNV